MERDPILRAYWETLPRETWLSRKETSEGLRALAYRVSPKTLAKHASQGTGPAYEMFGNLTRYRWGTALDWVRARSKPEKLSASAHRLTVAVREADATRS